MTFTWPEFREPTAIDAEASWTAAFESYDQRHDDVYYVVTRLEGAREAAQFIVVVSLHWSGDDWRGPEFVQRLREDVHDVALAGRTNTSYLGKMS